MVLYILIGLITAVNAQAFSNSINLQPVMPESETVIGRFNYFDLELLKVFGEFNRGNVFISPASIKTTLAMIYEGAKGKCKDEIGTALRINNINQDIIRQQLSRLLFDLNDRSPNTLLQSGNAIFVNNKLTLLPEYKQKIERDYKGMVKSLDFTDLRTATDEINRWATNATRGEIKQIVGEGSLFADTKLVIANALFFKGKWKTAFNVKDTSDKCFQSPTRGCINVPMMHVSDTFSYNLVTRLHAHAVELPYEDDKYSMLILLPADGNNIQVLIRDMQHASFYDIVDQIKPTEISLQLPRFEIGYNADLIQYLKPLNIETVFGPQANLTGIIAQDNVRINNIVHTTILQVNEQGTKAAAATAAIVIPLMGSSVQKIVVDKPFIFFIYHKESRNIIFEGIYSEPETHTKNDLPPARPPSAQRRPHNFVTQERLWIPPPSNINQFNQQVHRDTRRRQ